MSFVWSVATGGGITWNGTNCLDDVGRMKDMTTKIPMTDANVLVSERVLSAHQKWNGTQPTTIAEMSRQIVCFAIVQHIRLRLERPQAQPAARASARNLPVAGVKKQLAGTEARSKRVRRNQKTETRVKLNGEQWTITRSPVTPRKKNGTATKQPFRVVAFVTGRLQCERISDVPKNVLKVDANNIVTQSHLVTHQT
jgi:hypothetical protein